ncbi:hypothetical protein PMAC_001170 [Pneumocystis sp. 'macacae']|nr:hypothetical protein PMAC_001170 [Pneumocystis sp. 'macacae']
MDQEENLRKKSKDVLENANFPKKWAKISDLRSIAVESDSAAIREGEIDINNKNILKKSKYRGKKRIRLLTVHKLRKFAIRDSMITEMPKNENEIKEEFSKFRKASGKFSKRQQDKTWLPTHLWHAKRAKMLTRWSYSIAKTPTLKSYRLTHRSANTDGAIAFDTSYYCTICLWGEMENLKRVLQQFTINDSGVTKGRYIRGTRFCEAMIYQKDSNFLRLICPAYFLWQKIGNSQCVMVRFHPVAFRQVYIEMKEISSVENVVVEDCRFDIGSIDIHGPMSTLALQSLFDVKTSDTISQVCVISLPLGIIIPLNIRDPRLSFPPRLIDAKDKVFHDAMIKSWKDDLISPSELFNTDARLRCQKNQLSPQRINVLRSESSESSVPYDIPVLLLRCEMCWTILAPWNWITHLWYSLMHIPKVRFGGMQEKQQLEFEEGRPHFPSDYHGTLAGNENEKIEGQYRESVWKKKPSSKRISWSSVITKDGKGEHGNPFICDWSYLFLKFCKSNFGNIDDESKLLQADFHLISGINVKAKIDSDLYKSLNFVFIVKITMLRRGNPSCCARVYSIPPEEKEIWECFYKGMRCDDNKYPLCPSSDNLLGFVTTGNFNLKRGRATAIGCFSLYKISKVLADNKEKYCIVRNVGSSTVNIAKWDFID